MAKARKIAGEVDARRCLSAAEAAGQEPRDWARAHGVDARSLHVWRMHVKRRDHDGARPGRARGSSAAAASEPWRTGLVELVPIPPCSTAEPVAESSRASGATYTVEVAGARLSFGDDFSAAALRRVLEVLRSC